MSSMALLRELIENNNILIFDLLQLSNYKQRIFIEKCFGIVYDDENIIKLAKKYYLDPNHLYKFQQLESDVRTTKYVLIWQAKDSKEFYSTPFETISYFKNWISSYKDGSIIPICMIIDGVLSKMEFAIEQNIKFKIKE